MKKNIHPIHYKKVKIECACGHIFYAGSTKKEIKVETCSKCHPFFTGKKELLDIAKRADKFKKRKEKATINKTTKKKNK